MKIPRKISLTGLSLFLFAATVPTSCGDILPANSPESNVQQSATSSGSITGVVYTNISQSGTYVRPVGNVNIQVVDVNGEAAKTTDNKTLQNVEIDSAGRFYINNIAIEDSKAGQAFEVQIGQLDPLPIRLFPNRVINLGAVQITVDNASTSTEFVEVGGRLINASTQQPIREVTVRDKQNLALSTQTNEQGEFKFSVTRSNVNQVPQVELVLNETTPPIPLDFSKIQLTEGQTSLEPLRVQIDNIRTVQGVLRDETNSNLVVPNVKISIEGTDLSTVTGSDGRFVINGAPLNPFILKAEKITGYTGSSVQVSQANEKQEIVEQDISLRPLGNILVSFTSESVPGIGGGSNCIQGFNCVYLDQSNPPAFNDPRYDNTLAVTTELSAELNVKGTSISQTIAYPPAPVENDEITLPPSVGDDNTKPVRLRQGNVVISVLLKDVPGGRQTVTMSMTGHQTQKSIDIFVPPADTVSSELIVLHRVSAAKGIGDVKGVIKGIDPEDVGNVRVNYLDISDSQSYLPSTGETVANLQTRIQGSLSDGVPLITTDPAGNPLPAPYFYLKNVPTGTRITVVAGPIGGEKDCYIPNSAVLLNVEQGRLNFAPDITLNKRPTADCQ